MRIVVSACLLGENCKYNGKNNRNEALLQRLQGHEVIPVCPEVLGGLGVPRPCVELRQGVAYNQYGENVDAAFHTGVEKTWHRSRANPSTWWCCNPAALPAASSRSMTAASRNG